MPIYEYQCGSCGEELEKLQRMSDAPLTDCPGCGEAKLQRMVSAAGFRLKGAGWYETDFKKGSKKNLHDTGTSSKAGTADDKPVAKPAETKKPDAGTAASKSGAA
ncbi:MAG: zinc ribbon domain-containing protein [Gammaproteobacteria bacterium]|jgi:putative FmdB family regulatory protein|nr:zinc ribbon domain-containing protein [Gammaproteobacteria bacterium]